MTRTNCLLCGRVFKLCGCPPGSTTKEEMMRDARTLYQIEVVWNREFDFVSYGPSYSDEALAIQACKDAENSGDGARVKKARVVDCEGRVVFAYGKKVRRP